MLPCATGAVEDVNRQAEGVGERADEGLVGVGFSAAQTVIDVEDGRGHAEFVERMQQEDGIRAAGDGHADTSGNRGSRMRPVTS